MKTQTSLNMLTSDELKDMTDSLEGMNDIEANAFWSFKIENLVTIY